MKPKSEATITKEIMAALRVRGWLVYKIHGGPYQSIGLPDLLSISPAGRHMWVEVKKPGGKPTKIQDYRIAELEENYAEVLVVSSAEEVIHWIS